MAQLSSLLGTELPIIQAPMAGSQGSPLAIAVSNAGGLGSLPCALLGTEAMARELAAVAAGTRQPYAVNFFCHQIPEPDPVADREWRARLEPYYRELGVAEGSGTAPPHRLPFHGDAATILERFKPRVVTFHFGLPADDLLARVRGLGAAILASATTVAEARWLEKRGVDAIIAQGSEAGGHRGMFLNDDVSTQLGTFALVPQIVAAVAVPVIAAGGIADAAGVSAAMALGASAVQVGTAYLLSPEAATSAVHRAALAGDGAATTAMTNVFTGRPARGIVNRLIREQGPMTRAPAFPRAADPVAPLRAEAERRGSGDFSPMWAGQNTTGCLPIAAGEITRRLAGGLAVAG